MNIKTIRIMISIGLLIGFFNIQAQNVVQMVNQVVPPYSPYLSDYTGHDNRIILLLTNNEIRESVDISLAGTLEGDNGVSIEIPVDYRPPAPITLGPRETIRLTGLRLADYFNEQSLRVSGVEQSELFYGSGLPEGNYTLCLRAIDYNTGRFLSMPTMGCGFLQIRNLEPPTILQPFCGDTIAAVRPQNLFFNWTIPPGANPSNTEYLFRIVEMEEGILNPNQAIDAAPEIAFFEKVLNINTYQYSLADPPLIDGRSYAFRVTARARTDRSSRTNQEIRFRNNGRSEVCYFTYGNERTIDVSGDPKGDGIVEDPDVIVLVDRPRNPKDDPPSGGSDVLIGSGGVGSPPEPSMMGNCDSDYQSTDPGGTLIGNLNVGDNVSIGKFVMNLTTVQKVGDGYNGTGTVLVDFLNTRVRASFNNLKVNTNGQAFDENSRVIALNDVGMPLEVESFASGDVSDQQLQDVAEAVNSPSRQTINLDPDNTAGVSLPLAIHNSTGNLMFLGLVFTPTTAYSHVAVSAEIALGVDNNHLNFFQLQYIQPGGIGSNQTVNIGTSTIESLSTHTRLIFDSETRVSYGCEGITSFTLAGAMEFDRNLVLPLNNQGEVIASPTKVAASFEAEVTDVNDWQVAASLEGPATIPALVGFEMEATDIIFDFRTSWSPPASGRPSNWTGLYIGSLAVKLPQLFEINDQRLVIETDNFTLDRFGMSGGLNPGPNLMSIDDGTLGGWPFSISTFSMTIENSGLEANSITGELNIPISSNELDYDLILQASIDENSSVEFELSVVPGQQLNVDMWFAQLELEQSSTVGLQPVGDTYRPVADLNGSITFGWDNDNQPSEQNSVSQLTIPSLDFNNFVITSDANNIPEIESFVLAVDGVDLQANLVGFNVGLDVPQFIKQDDEFGVRFGFDVALSPGANAIGGGTEFTIWGKLNNGRYEYERTQLNAIEIDVDVAVAYILGSVEIYNNDEEYGNGFRGEIEARIRGIGVGLDAALQVGKVDGYRYWYFDIFVNLGQGIPLPPTIAAINGIGGGAWYNMERESLMEPTNVNELNNKSPYSLSPGATADGVKMTPNQEMGFGFSAALSFGIYGAQTMFNSDLKFGMTITDDGGVAEVFMEGGGYMFQAIDDRDGAIISGTVEVVIQPKLSNVDNDSQNRPNFHLTSTMNLNLLNMLQGQGSLDLYFSPNDWHIYLGKWTNEDYPENDDSRIKIGFNALNILNVVFHSYFMAGTDIPPMPALPLVVRQQFAEDNLVVGSGQRDQVSSSNDPNSGGLPGIAVGAGLHMDFDLKFLIFYMNSQMDLGFDVTLLKYANPPCENGDGFHNWYARGQAYGYFDFAIGAELDIWIWKGKLELVKAVAAAYVDIALPNPTYIEGEMFFSVEVLNGALKFENSFEFELGEKCKSSGNGPFDFPIVAEVTPTDDQSNVNVYRTPEIVFNFPEGPFTYTERIDGEPVERTYYYKLVSYKLEWIDADTNQAKERELKGNAAYRADGYSASYYDQNQRFPEETNVTYTAIAQGWQKLPGSDLKVTEEDEITTGTFTTGPLPDKIPAEHLAYGSPRFRENFYLTEEFDQGFIEMKHPYDHLLSPTYWYEDKMKLGNYQGPEVSGQFRFRAEFRDTKTGQIIRRNLSVGPASRIRFNIPNNLKKDNVYELGMVVIFIPPANGLTPGNTKSKYTDVLINGSGTNNGFSGSGTLVFQGASTHNQQVFQQNQTWAVAVASGASANTSGASQFDSNEPDNDNGGGNKIFGGATNWAIEEPEQEVYIQRKERELLQQKKGENRIVFSLFDGFNYYFETSKYGTLQEKLNQVSVHDVKVTTFGSEMDAYHGSEVIWNQDEGFQLSSNSATIVSEVPVVMMKSAENFDEFYAIPVRINLAPNVYKTYDPVIAFSTVYGDEQWYANGFWDRSYADKRKAYRMIDFDVTGKSWEKLSFYGEDGYSIGSYDALDIPYPSPYYWDLLLPELYDTYFWDDDRYKGNNQFQPFGKFDMPSPASSTNSNIAPFLTFYSSVQHPNVNFNGLPVGFRKTPLAFEEDEPEPEDQVFNPSISLNTGGTSTPTMAPIYEIADPIAYFAMVDYTEWVAMRDLFLLKKYIYEINEENIDDNIEGCEQVNNNQIGDFPGANCYYQGIKNYILNHHYYRSRPNGVFNFSIQRFGTENDAKTNYEYTSPKLND